MIVHALEREHRARRRRAEDGIQARIGRAVRGGDDTAMQVEADRGAQHHAGRYVDRCVHADEIIAQLFE